MSEKVIIEQGGQEEQSVVVLSIGHAHTMAEMASQEQDYKKLQQIANAVLNGVNMYGKAAEYHNLGAEFARQDDYFNAYSIVKRGLDRQYSNDIDLLADAIHYGSCCGENDECKRLKARLMARPRGAWNWRAFTFLIDYLKEQAEQAPAEKIMQILDEALKLCKEYHADADQIAGFSNDLAAKFHITPWLLLVPVLTGLLIAKKVPAVITLFAASVIAGIFALVFQPHIIAEIAGSTTNDGLSFIEGFNGLFQSYYGSTSIDTGNADLNELIATRGMTGMLLTIFLIITAATFGGVLMGSGMLQSLTEALVRFVHRRVTMVASTVGTGIFANMITGDQYLSIILTSSLYKKLYKDRKYENRLLSRSVEDSATVVSVLIPWNSCGMTQATVLKVATLEYLPYCFFNLISPLMSIFIAAIGYRIKREK